MDEEAMHPRWARGGKQGWVQSCERAVGERSEMWDECWYFSGLETGIGMEIQGRRTERAEIPLVVMESAVVSVGWEWRMRNGGNLLDAGACLDRTLGLGG